jgi:hypothetical protein
MRSLRNEDRRGEILEDIYKKPIDQQKAKFINSVLKSILKIS